MMSVPGTSQRSIRATSPKRLAPAFIAAAALVGSLVTATPAAAMPIAAVPPEAQWATPYSPLPVGDIAVQPGLRLDFAGENGGIPTAGDIGTGFTMVQPSTADPDHFVPESLSVADGKLAITASKGIAYLVQPAVPPAPTSTDWWKNKQDNTLGVGLDATAGPFRLGTAVTPPANVLNSSQGGLWFGPDDDNYVKIVVAGTGTNTATQNNRQIQLSREINGVVVQSGTPPQDQRNFDTTAATLGSGPIRLWLDVAPPAAGSPTGTVVGKYQIGTGAITTLGNLTLPANFFDGTLLDAAVPDATSFAGVSTTKRNQPETTAQVFTFEDFSLTELSPPAAPGSPVAAASSDAVALGWAAPADEDLAGYRVYRAPTAPVATTGTPISGATLLTGPTFTDTDVFVGATYQYAIVAVDVDGNASVAATTSAQVPAPAGTLVEKFDFTTAAGTAAPGYTKDAGAPYSAAAGFGWLTSDDKVPFDFGVNTRIRTNPAVSDPRLLSLIHLAYGQASGTPNPLTGITTEVGTWEVDVPDGTYRVVAAAGDTTTNYDSTHAINAEGVPVVTPFVGSAAREFEQGIADVEVTDGKLTIDQVGGTNSKLAFLEIYEVAPAPLATPGDVAAAYDDEAVEITWGAVDAAVGYDVYRAESEPVPTDGAPLNAAPLTDESFSDGTVEPGHTYYYVVVARGAGSVPASEPSTAAGVVIPGAVQPAAPANPTGTVDAEGDVVLAWDAVPDVAGYRVFRGTTPSVATDGIPLSGVDLVTAATFTDVTAEPDTTYHYVVVAVGTNELVSAASATVAVTTPDEDLEPGECSVTQWSGEYFDGQSLQGTAVESDCLDDLDLQYSQGDGPDGVGPFQYSARFSKTFDGAGAYTIEAVADDGIRVLVDGEPVIDGWVDQGPTPFSGTVDLGEGSHLIVVEYFQGWGGATLEVDVSIAQAACESSVWSVRYFGNTGLDGAPTGSDCLDDLDHEYAWNEGPEGVGPWNWSARYTKTIQPGAGSYDFTVLADDGVRVEVDGIEVIDGWFDQGPTSYTGTIALDDGTHVVVVEYFQGWSGAKLEFDYVRQASTCESSAWSATYYAGTSLAGLPLATDCLDGLNQVFNAGDGPAGVGATQYSARFARTIDDGAGTYDFQVLADDGVRVKVDGTTVIDGWHDQAPTEFSGSIDLSDGPHTVIVEYFQGWGGATLELDYTVDAGSVCAPSDWGVKYYAGTALFGQAIATDCVDTIDQAYGKDEGPEGVGVSQYSARYTKQVDEGAGTYTFRALADDGVRVKVDGATVIDGWHDQGPTEFIGSKALAAGPHTIVVEYFQGWGGATIQFEYERNAPDTTAPEAPTGLVATADDGEIDLSWSPSASSDVIGYNVYRGTTPGVTTDGTPLNGATPLDEEEYSDDTAAAGTTYFYVVTAVDGPGNESVVSNEVVGLWEEEVDVEAPAAPTTLTGTSGDEVVALAWTASTATDVAGYRVYRSLEPFANFTGELITTALVTTAAYSDLDVENNTTYYYLVTAVDLAGNESTVSNEIVAAPQPVNNTNIKIDFTKTDGVPVAGYYADWGQTYGQRTSPGQGSGLSYGWMDVDGHDLSLVSNGRERLRAGVDPKVDSMIHMQYGMSPAPNPATGVLTEGKWEIALPGGLYQVTFAVGDQGPLPNGYDSNHVINVEGSAALEGFKGTAAAEYRTVTTTVGVWDGRLTVDALGGTNTKLGYIEILGKPWVSHIDTVNPSNRVVDADVNGGVAATIKLPYAGFGVDDTTMPGNVLLYELPSGTPVVGSVNTSGGNDTVNFAPTQPLKPTTSYRFVVTSGVKDHLGNPFVPFTSVFTTGQGTIELPGEFEPITNVAFEKVELPIGVGRYWASFAFGPDGKLYGTTIGQGIFRYTVNADGTLSNEQNLGHAGRANIGLVWDESSTAGDLRLWVTDTSANVGGESGQWISGVSLLSGPNLQTKTPVFTGLPRSQNDHLTNSMAYGPDGRIYIMQGSNQASGDNDGSWGQRGEQLLTASVLVFDPDDSRVQAAAAGGAPINVQTAGVANPYDPFAANAPLKLYATGIRNAYDLVWHSNGHLYTATNGTAGGANTPGVTANANGTYTRVAANGIPGFSAVNGQDVTSQCVRRGYTGGSVPARGNIGTQRDLLFDIQPGKYYGHPNPTRCEWVLNEGNDPANPPKSAGQGANYPVGVLPDANYGGIAYDFEYNKSPNGMIEYQADTFGGQLKNRLVVVRFSNNNDLIFLQPDQATGKILGAQTEVGITGVPNTTIGGVGGFNDPLEIVEDPNNGNMYLNQYDRAGSAQKLYLLRVPESQQASKLTSSSDELIFSAAKSNAGNASAAQKTDVSSLTVTNQSNVTVPLSTSIAGTNAGEFQVVGTVPSTLAAGASTTLQVRFTPGTTIGQRSAQLTITGGDGSAKVGLYGVTTNGIEGENEAPLNDVVKTLGYNITVGWNNVSGGVQPTAKGDEVLEPLFVKSGSAAPTWKALAHYAPQESIPFGWYTGDGAAADRHELGAIDVSGYQSLLPPVTPASTPSFDPGTATFGFYYRSNVFNRYGYTEDRLNTGTPHRARIYPAKNRAGVLLPNTYLVAFEDASNGDYQDYLFLVTGVRPVSETGSPDGDIKVDFTSAAGRLAAGYLRDHGQAYGARTGADQGSGLTYGWKNADTEVDLDISVGGTTPGNGRDRASVQTDVRLDTIMHMQPEGITGTFNGTKVDAFWEIEVPNGQYEVTVGVGDSSVNTDPESHRINVENVNLIAGFVPTGAAGSNTHHQIATGTFTVVDGHLTVDANGGTNTKIGFVDIVPVEVQEPGPDDPSDGAQVKIRFQPASVPVVDGWAPDSGAAYTDALGYGWLNAANGQPVDRSIATRYRTAATGGVTFPTDEKLKGFAFLDNASQPTYTNGVWEYKVPNGEYDIGVSVGDANFLDSTHGVMVEGQPIIQTFVPTAATPFQTGARHVTVTDGKLTVTNSGTNTKINWLSIKGDGLEEPPSQQPLVQVNFGPSGVTLPAGWINDNGQAYAANVGYGWLVDGAPGDRTNATRNRTAPAAGIAYPLGDATRQTLILMQNTTTAGSPIAGMTNGVWEYAVANGVYTVSASVGDAGYLDSIHGVSAEGTSLVSAFTPIGSAPFATGTAQVTVTDGKLTVAATGTNTKLNWVTIQGASAGAPSVVVKANGQDVEAAYSGGEAMVTVQAVAAVGATLDTLTYSLNGAAPVPYTGQIQLTTVGEYELVVTATDDADRTTTRTVDFEILNIGGTLTLRNQQATRVNNQASGEVVPGFYEDTLVMHRVNGGLVDVHANLRYNDTATVNLVNTGPKDLRITSMAIGGSQAAQFTLVDPPALPLTIAPGQTVPLTAQFTATTGGKGVRTAHVDLVSSDPASPTTQVFLRGGYMGTPEGNSELTLPQIVSLFDYQTNVGPLTSEGSGMSIGYGSENPGSPLNGEEVRGPTQWKRLDASKPVQARQLAAFHGCCGATETINVNGTSVTQSTDWGQAILPRTGNTATSNAAQLVTNPTGNFNITVSGQNTNNANYMAVKTWPLRDRAGAVVPGAWVVGHDYIASPNQCGTGPTNCDFQDNVYIVTNVVPVTPSDTVAPAAPTGLEGSFVAPSVRLSWPARTGDVAGFLVERAASASGPWTRITPVPITASQFTDAAFLGGSSVYRILAVDAAMNTSAPSNAVAVTTPMPPLPTLRYNAGGAAMTIGGVAWAADPATGASGYRSYSNPAVTAISGTTNDQLYFTSRSDSATSFGYDIAVPNGTYTVSLHFVELYFGAPGGGANNANARRFSINLDGGPVEKANYSILQDVGPTTLDVETFTVTVTDGNLDIDLSATANQPTINAIEIVPA